MKKTQMLCVIAFFIGVFSSCKKETITGESPKQNQCETKKDLYPYKSYSRADTPPSPELLAFFKRLDSIPDVKGKQIALREFKMQQAKSSGEKYAFEEGYSWDWEYTAEINAYYCSIENDNDPDSYYNGALQVSKRVKWLVGRKYQAWDVWSEEKFFLSDYPYGYFICTGGKHIRSYAEAFFPCYWQEIQNMTYAGYALCKGELSVYYLGLPGESRAEKYLVAMNRNFTVNQIINGI